MTSEFLNAYYHNYFGDECVEDARFIVIYQFLGETIFGL
jgi:hypothetical protein